MFKELLHFFELLNFTKVDPEGIKGVLVVISVAIFAILLFIVFRSLESSTAIIPFGILFLILGSVFESSKIIQNRNQTFITLFASIAFSLVLFTPIPYEGNYDFDSRARLWPILIISFFCYFVMKIKKEKIVPKLTEGIALFQSIALVYWLLEKIVNGFGGFPLVLSILFILVFCLLAFYHAFTYSPLSDNSRFWLSIWESIIFLIFSINQILFVFSISEVGFHSPFFTILIVAIDFFLLGVSSIYIVNNFFMIIGFLPGQNRFFDKYHMLAIESLKKLHIERFSNTQVNIQHSFVCLVHCLILFNINFWFNLFSINTSILFTFFTLPFSIIIYDKFKTN